MLANKRRTPERGFGDCAPGLHSLKERTTRMKRPRGRPKKIKDSIKPWEFGRLARVFSAYDELRERGQKHSAAITEVAGALKQRSPQMPISETGVRRILSKHRPKGSRTILRFERTLLTEEDRERRRRMWEQVAVSQEITGITLPKLPDFAEKRPREAFLFRFSERPEYPRHNRRPPKE